MTHRLKTMVSFMAVLAGCAPLDTYYKPGATVANMQRTTTECAVSALEKVPPSTQLVRDPPQFVPPHQRCNSQGQCHVTPGYFVPGAVYEIDPNAQLRRRVVGQCMADAGFDPVQCRPSGPCNVHHHPARSQCQILRDPKPRRQFSDRDTGLIDHG